MNLIREECEKALNGLRILEREENFKKWNQVAPQIKCDVIESLIHEHFDNQPLKFEELEEKMWVWYKPLKEWKKIYRINPFCECFRLIEFNDGYLAQFKENIFYRKQVEE